MAVSKRKWKTVDLDEEALAMFSEMGGLEIEVLSDDGASKYGGACAPAIESESKKAKKKKKVKKAVAEGVSSAPTEEATDATPVTETIDLSEWNEFETKLHPRILEGLSGLRFTKPSPIQKAVLDSACRGLDILGAAQTGSGKTLGFGLPIMHMILSEKLDEQATRALCVLPTRELALQVQAHLQAVVGSKVTIGTAVGGMSVEKQSRILSKRPDIVVGTPGRIASLLGLSKPTEDGSSQTCEDFKTNLCTKLRYLVLDEADRLLEQAHFRDLTQILRFVYTSIPLVESMQTFVFSATLPLEGSDLGRLLKKLRMKKPNQRFSIDLGRKSEDAFVPQGLSFKAMFCSNEDDREAYLAYYLHRKISGKVIVFVNAISYVYRLASVLPLCLPAASRVVGIHSNLRQKDRLKKLDQFKAPNPNGLSVMIATDLAARGLDLPEVSAVVHLQPPRSSESLIHRSGRTARAGRSGECIMIVTPKLTFNWNKCVKQALNTDIASIEAIEVVSLDINHVRAIHKLASDLEGQTHKTKRDSKNAAWSQKTCEEADLWDSDNENKADAYDSDIIVGDEQVEVTSTRKSVTGSGNYSSLQCQLDEMVKNPLPSLLR